MVWLKDRLSVTQEFTHQTALLSLLLVVAISYDSAVYLLPAGMDVSIPSIRPIDKRPKIRDFRQQLVGIAYWSLIS
jgi:hypothetical protein